MGFDRNWTPFYESNEREKELAIQRQAQQNQQTQQMLQLAMQGVGMGLRQWNESQDRDLRREGMAQQQGQFEASQAQQLKEFTDRINFDRSWRDEQLQQRMSEKDGAAKAYELATGQKWDGPLPSASILSPFITKKLEADYRQAEINQDIQGKVALGQALQLAEQKSWESYAPVVADKLGKFTASGLIPEEIAQQYMGALQASPASSRVIDTELDKAFFTSIAAEQVKLKNQKVVQQLGAWGTDPGFASTYGEEAAGRALVASKGIELGVWTDPADAMAFVFPKKQGGTSEAERAINTLPPQERLPAMQNRGRELSGLNKTVKDPEAIGEARAGYAGAKQAVESAKEDLDALEKRYTSPTDEQKDEIAAARHRLRTARGRLADTEGQKGRAEAGTKRSGIGPSAPTVQAQPSALEAKPAGANLTKQDAVKMAAMELGKGATPEAIAKRAREIFEKQGQ